MKILILVFVLLWGAAFKASADTVSYWSVRYNDSLILYGNIVSPPPELRLSASAIEALDLITVRYVHDGPCSDCPVRIRIENAAGEPVASGEARSTFRPVPIPAYQLLQYRNSGKLPGTLNVFYLENAAPEQRRLLFRIQLE